MQLDCWRRSKKKAAPPLRTVDLQCYCCSTIKTGREAKAAGEASEK